MGRGFRCGFLGMLHLEIITERLRREFALELVVTLPTTVYEVTKNTGEVLSVYSPARFPDDGTVVKVREEWARVHIYTPKESLGNVVQLLHDHEAITETTETLPDGRIELVVLMALREMMRGFFDKLKNASSGFASLSYELIGLRDADVVRSIATTPFAMNGGITVQATVAVALPKKSTPFTFSVPVQKDVYYMYLEECFCTLKGKRKAGNVAVLFVAKDPVLFEIMLARDTARYERYLSFLPRFLNERRGKAKSFQLKCKTPPTVR
jgi:hypothetical protein